MYGIETLKKFIKVIVDTANLVILMVADHKFNWSDVLTCVKELPGIIKELIEAIKERNQVDDEFKDLNEAELGELALFTGAHLAIGEGKAKKIVLASISVMAASLGLVKAILAKEEPAVVVEAPAAPEAPVA